MGSTQQTTINSVFFDTTVLYSALFSASGASRIVLLSGLSGEFSLSLSHLVLVECQRNLLADAPHLAATLQTLTNTLQDFVVTPPQALIDRALEIVVAKDAPIVAAAAHARAEYLVTLDRRHLIAKRQAIQEAFGVVVTTPGELVTLLRA